MIRIIGLDLDGTVLTRKKELTAANRAALQEAAENGIYIVPVTGRPLSGVPEQIMDLPFIRYVITSNGAVTTDRSSGNVIRERYMTAETAHRTLVAAEGEGIIREYFAEGFGFHDAGTRKLLWKRFEGTPVLQYLKKSRVQVKSKRDRGDQDHLPLADGPGDHFREGGQGRSASEPCRAAWP